jgi:hypothetical protein
LRRPFQSIKNNRRAKKFMANYTIIGGDGKEYGPITETDVRQWISEGRLAPQSLAKGEGDAEFRPLEKFPEFADILTSKISPTVSSAADVATSTNFLERDYELDIGDCIGQGWNLYKKNFGVLFGSFIIAGIILFVFGGVFNMLVLTISPKLVSGTGISKQLFGLFFNAILALIMGPLMGGVYYIFLQRIRNQAAGIGDMFIGFQKAYAQLFLGQLVVSFIIGLCMLPYNLVSATKMDPILQQLHQSAQPSPAEMQNLLPQMGAAFASSLPVLLICLIPVTYLSINWQFTLALIIDKQMTFGTAMKTSWKMVHKHWWQLFGLVVVAGLVSVAGVLGCCIGIIFTIPIGIAAILTAYETIFGETRNH